MRFKDKHVNLKTSIFAQIIRRHFVIGNQQNMGTCNICLFALYSMANLGYIDSYIKMPMEVATP